MQVQMITIDASADGQRIDNFLMGRFKRVPKSRLYKAMRKGEVRVNKRRIKPTYKLAVGDIVRVPPLVEPPSEPREQPCAQHGLVEVIADRILYEDKHYLIINKPAGLPVHGGTKQSWSLTDVLPLLRPREKYLRLAHRLDKATSGCMVIAKRRQALLAFQEAQQAGTVEKIYHAWVKGVWPADKTQVDWPLQKNVQRSGERVVTVDPAGKTALTYFRVLEVEDGCTLLEATLVTGRTHQIRVHCAASGYPIVGDEKYGDRAFNKRSAKAGRVGMQLHAHTITFTYQGKAVTVTA